MSSTNDSPRLFFDEYKCYSWQAHVLLAVVSVAVGLAAYFLIVQHAESSLGSAILSADVEDAIYRKDAGRYEAANITAGERTEACERFLILAHGLNLPMNAETVSRSDRELCAAPAEGPWKAPDELELLHHVLSSVGWPQQRRPTVALLVRMVEKSQPGRAVGEAVNGAAPRDPSPFHTLTESRLVKHIGTLGGPRDEALLEELLWEHSWLKARPKDVAGGTNGVVAPIESRQDGNPVRDTVWCVHVDDKGTHGPLPNCAVTTDTGPVIDSQRAVLIAFFVASLSEIRADESVRDAFNTLALWKGWPQLAMLVIFAYALFWQIPRTWSSVNDWRDVRRSLRDVTLTEPARALPRAIFAEARHLRTVPKGAHATRSGARLEDPPQTSATVLESATADFRADLAAHRGRLQVASWPVSVSAALLPMLGFIGTVVGIMDGLGRSDTMVRALSVFEQAAAVQDVAGSLGLAFGTTFIALAFGVVLTTMIGISSGVESAWMSRVELEVRPPDVKPAPALATN